MRPSPVSVSNPAWLRLYADSHAGGQGHAMHCEADILVRPLELSHHWLGDWRWILQAAIGFRHIIPISHAEIYMPTFGNHRNNRKTAPILFDVENWGTAASFVGISAIFSVVNTCDLRLGDSVVSSPQQTCSPKCREENIGINSSKLQSGVLLHKRIHI